MKNINWKELLFQWADKVVVGICALLALFAIWSSYSTDVFKGDPNQIVDNARKADAIVKSNKWPDEMAQEYRINPDEAPSAVVRNSIRTPVPPGLFEFEQSFPIALTTESEPLKEPEWLAVESLISTASEVIIPVSSTTDTAEGDTETGTESAVAKADKNDPDADIPEYLRVTRPSAAAAGDLEGQFGPAGSSPTASSSGAGQYNSYESEYAGYGTEDAYSVQGVDGEGRQFVAVRGIFPLRKQVLAIQKAINASSYFEARAMLDMMNIEIERKAFRPGSNPDDSQWESVDLRVAEDVLASSSGIEPDAVPARITDPVITMPLPARIRGLYGTVATHPRIDNFVLSPEEMERELAILSAMADEIRKKGDEAKLAAPAQKKGFQQFVIGAQNVYDVYSSGYEEGYNEDYSGGGGYPSAGGYPGSGYPSGGSGYPSAGGYPGGGYPGGGGYGAPQSRGLNDQALTAILEKVDPESRHSDLKKWISRQATAEEEYLLFRYLDFDVEPNRSYVYRVRLELRNPNFGRSVADAGGLAHVVEGETRFTEWSTPTEISTTPRTTDFFVARVNPPRARSPITATVDVYQWDSDLGTVVRGNLEVQPGQLIGGRVDTEVLDPAAPSLEYQPYEFKSQDVLLDAVADSKLELAFHPGLSLPQGAKGGEMLLPEAIVYADDDGTLVVVDEVATASTRRRKRDTLKVEREQYEYLRKAAEAPVDDLEGYYGEGYGGGESSYNTYSSDAEYGYGGYGGYGAGSGRRLSNPLSRRK